MPDTLRGWRDRFLAAFSPRLGEIPPPKAPARPAPAQARVIMQVGVPVTEVIIHTTATGADWWKGKTAAQMVAEITGWHRKNGWRTIGYHGLIAPDGSWAPGRPFTEKGAHVKERNSGTIGITLVPIKDVDPRRVGRFEDYYTEAQRKALKAKIAAIAAMTDLKTVSGHNDHTKAKTCPGFYVKPGEWMP